MPWVFFFTVFSDLTHIDHSVPPLEFDPLIISLTLIISFIFIVLCLAMLLSHHRSVSLAHTNRLLTVWSQKMSFKNFKWQ